MFECSCQELNDRYIFGLQQITNPQPWNILLSLVPGRACARAAGERRIPLVCTHANVPTARSEAETPQDGAPANPTLIRSEKKTTYNADNRFLFYNEARERSEPFFPWFSKGKKASSYRVVRA